MEIRLKINDNMSKQEEIDILHKLRDTYTNHPDNYLATLFSHKFTSWAGLQIKNDFPVNPMEYITVYSEKEWEKEIKDLKEELEEAQQGIIEMNEVAHNSTKTVEYYKKELCKLEEIIDEKTMSIADQSIKINNLEGHIVSLKAKLYDLTINK